jgi:hypothetical protein
VTAVAIVGMHRSGTSWLAGTLQELGLELGVVDEVNPYNARGNREHTRIQELHASVFQAAGGSWRNPPGRAHWSDAQRDELGSIVADLGRAGTVWGFKDPRTLFVLDEWRAVVPDLEVVGIYRNPEAVAASLGRRGSFSMPRREALALWTVYNRRLVEIHRARPFPVLCFDRSASELAGQVGALANGFGLVRHDVDPSFFDASLVHHGALERVPWRARPTWRALEAAAVRTDAQLRARTG